MDDDYKIKPFSIVLPKTSAYVKSYDGKTKWMYFLNENDESLEEYDDIWNNVSSSIEMEFYRKPIYNKRIVKS